jgi:hypothetical protein
MSITESVRNYEWRKDSFTGGRKADFLAKRDFAGIHVCHPWKTRERRLTRPKAACHPLRTDGRRGWRGLSEHAESCDPAYKGSSWCRTESLFEKSPLHLLQARSEFGVSLFLLSPHLIQRADGRRAEPSHDMRVDHRITSEFPVLCVTRRPAPFFAFSSVFCGNALIYKNKHPRLTNNEGRVRISIKHGRIVKNSFYPSFAIGRPYNVVGHSEVCRDEGARATTALHHVDCLFPIRHHMPSSDCGSHLAVSNRKAGERDSLGLGFTRFDIRSPRSHFVFRIPNPPAFEREQNILANQSAHGTR